MPTLRFEYGVLDGRLSRGNFPHALLQADCLPEWGNQADFPSVCVREIHNGVKTQPTDMRRWPRRATDRSAVTHAFRQFSVVQLNPYFHQAITGTIINGGSQPPTLMIRYPLHVDALDKTSHQLLLLRRRKRGQKVIESLKIPPDTLLFQDHRVCRRQLLAESFLLHEEPTPLIAQVCGTAQYCVA